MDAAIVQQSSVFSSSSFLFEVSMRIALGWLSACIIWGVVEIANGATVTETFDSAASAAANGWTVFGSGSDGNVAGWINSNDAGGVAGEAQADFRRSTADVYYADTNLGVSLSGSTSFSSSGKLDVLSIVGAPDFNGRVTFFNGANPGTRVGIGFNDAAPGVIGWGILLDVNGNFIWQTGFGFGSFSATNVDRTFSFAYDPTIGNGQFTAAISGAGAPVVRDLTAAERTQLDGLTFDAFGFFKAASGSTQDLGANFRFDDVSYTAVPEPSSIVIATFAVLGLLGTVLGRRRSYRH